MYRVIFSAPKAPRNFFCPPSMGGIAPHQIFEGGHCPPSILKFWALPPIKNLNCASLGGPLKFWSMCCSIGPPKIMFYCIFKKEFWGCVVLWDQIFLEKSPKNSKNFRKFSQKINVLRFKMVLNGRILKNFDEIAHKTPHRPFLEKF